MKKIILSFFLICFYINTSINGMFAQVISSIFGSCCGDRKEIKKISSNNNLLILTDETRAKEIPKKAFKKTESNNSLSDDARIIESFELFKEKRRKKSSSNEYE